jgi:hypothetical protein
MTTRTRTAPAAAVLLAAALAAPAAAGIRYGATTTTQAAGQGKPTTMVVDGTIDGASARIEFRESGNPMFGAGSYLLTRDGGQTLFIVDPEERTYAVLDLDQMLAGLGGMMQAMGPVLQFEFTDPQVERLAEGPGEAIHGLPTTHVRTRTRYAMKLRILGMSRESQIETVQEVWATTALADVGLGVWLRQRQATGNAQLDQLIAAESGRVEGVPLKLVSVSTTTDGKGRSTESRTTTEVTRLERDVAVAAASFELPPGYRQVELPALAGPGMAPR